MKAWQLENHRLQITSVHFVIIITVCCDHVGHGQVTLTELNDSSFFGSNLRTFDPLFYLLRTLCLDISPFSCWQCLKFAQIFKSFLYFALQCFIDVKKVLFIYFLDYVAFNFNEK